MILLNIGICSRSKGKSSLGRNLLIRDHVIHGCTAERVKQPDLEHALLVLPFATLVRLIKMLIALSRSDYDLELCCRASVLYS